MSIVSGYSNWTPLAVPPNEIGDSVRASDLALPWPLAPPMSAARQAAVFASAASDGGP